MNKKLRLIICWFYCVLFLSASLSAQEYTLIRRLGGHAASINAIRFSPAGKWIASVSKDQSLKIWDMKSNKERYTLGHSTSIYTLNYSSDGSLIASAGSDQLIKVWKANEGKLLWTFEGHTDYIHSLCFSPDGQYLYSTGEDARLFVWDIKRGKKSEKFQLEESVLSIDVSPDGRYLALGDWNGMLHIWDSETFSNVYTFSHHTSQIHSVKFSPDGNMLASAGADKRIYIWDISSQKMLKMLKGHQLAIHDLAFSPDMNFLASAGRDRLLQIWDLQQGTIAKTIPHRLEVTSVDFSPNGKLIATGSRDGQIRVFLRPEAKEVLVSDNQTINRPLAAFKGKSEVDFQLPPYQGSNPNAVAVVIGNKDYEHKDIPSVDFALQDAGSIKKYLIEVFGFQEENIIYLQNAKLADFTGAFGTKDNSQARLYNLIKAGESEVFIYYSGHGAPELESGIGYFIPSDCDPALIAFQGYSTRTFYENLAKLPYKSLTVVVDACFSGSSENGQLIQDASPVFIKPKIPVIRKANSKVFTSSRGTQISSWYPAKSHGLFTYYFLKGLKGEANKNKDERLTLSELNQYLSEEVPYMARKLKNRRQTPEVFGRSDQVILTY